jgi:hypothetical protein
VREQLERLARVQELDSEIGTLRRQIGELDDGSVLEQKIKAAEAKVEKLKAAHGEKVKAQRQVEEEIQRVQQKLDREKQRLEAGDVGGHRDVIDLQRHVQSLGQYLVSTDEKLHNLISDADAAKSKVAELEKTLAKAYRRLAQIREQHKSERERLEKEIKRIEATRDERASEVDPELLSKYDAIRVRTEDNRGLVTLDEPICKACGTAIPTLMFDRLLLSEDMAFCENCGRIIVRETE